MKASKKLTALISVAVLLLSTAACTGEDSGEDNKETEKEKSSVAGEYFSVDMATETAVGGFNDDIIEKSLKYSFVEGDDPSEGTLETKLLDYKWSVEDDILTLEVTKDNSPTASINDQTGTKTEYIIYKNCLVDTSSDIYELYDNGTDMSEGKIDASYECSVDNGAGMTEYTSIQFDSEDNYCELEYYSTFNGNSLSDVYADGTYTTDGNIVILNMEVTDSDGNIKEDRNFYMYIDDDGTLYTTMYMKA